MSITMTMSAGTRIELGVGTVTPGREQWMYGEYFPAMGPLMAGAGFHTLAPFAVVASNMDGAPVQGSFSCWPSAEKRRRFIAAPAFQAVVETRDASFDCFSDGHLFEGSDQTVELTPGEDYAIVVAQGVDMAGAPLLDLPLAADSVASDYAGRSVTLRPWSDEAEALLTGSPAEAAVFRVRFKG